MEFKKFSAGKFTYGQNKHEFIVPEESGITNCNFYDVLYNTHVDR